MADRFRGKLFSFVFLLACFALSSLLIFERSFIQNRRRLLFTREESSFQELTFAEDIADDLNRNYTKQKRISFTISANRRKNPSYIFKLHAVFHSATCKFTAADVADAYEEEFREVQTIVLYDVTPVVRKHVESMFADHVRHEAWFKLYPFQISCLPFRGLLNCVVRVWLRLDRFQVQEQMVNRFQDSFMYHFQLDEKLNMVQESGRILGIPSPIQELKYTGPEDPRLIEFDDDLYLNFINSHAFADGSEPDVGTLKRTQFLWSLTRNRLFSLVPSGFKSKNVAEKNWTPFVDLEDGRLTFVYQFESKIRVMKCQQPQIVEEAAEENSIKCSLVSERFQQPPESQSTFNAILRGGSPAIHYRDDYYLAVTHSVHSTYPDGGQIYAAQLVLFNVRSYHIVLLTSPILIDPKLMMKVQRTAANIAKPFLYARSVFAESADSLIVATGLNDNACYLIRLQGISSLLRKAIENDQKLNSTCLTSELTSERFKNVHESMINWLKTTNSEVLRDLFDESPELAA